jgi:pSer/pThr/pTyr-binding forkhead associated (FHA) protein
MGVGMPAQLVALTDGPSILLDKPILLIGRNPECDIQIDSRKVSRRHCCIAQVHDYLVVRDLGSTNGVRINGVRVVEGRIRQGDELTIGSNRYQVQLDGAAVPSIQVAEAAERHAVDDDRLESCDEPVALSDSGKVACAVAQPGVPPPEPVSPLPPVVPEELELAPSSDSFPAPPIV